MGLLSSRSVTLHVTQTNSLNVWLHGSMSIVGMPSNCIRKLLLILVESQLRLKLLPRLLFNVVKLPGQSFQQPCLICLNIVHDSFIPMLILTLMPVILFPRLYLHLHSAICFLTTRLGLIQPLHYLLLLLKLSLPMNWLLLCLNLMAVYPAAWLNYLLR